MVYQITISRRNKEKGIYSTFDREPRYSWGNLNKRFETNTELDLTINVLEVIKNVSINTDKDTLLYEDN